MELKEFITNTLSEIAQGVADAKPLYKSLGGEINPGIPPYVAMSPTMELIQINFEVALSDNTSNKNTKGIGVMLSIVSAGGDKVAEKSAQSVTKICFSVPVYLP